MAWTTKSSLPQRSFDGGENACRPMRHSSTSHGRQEFEPSFGRQRLHALAQRLALIGEGQFGALRGQRLGDAPGDGVVVGDPHDQAAFALHHSRHGLYPL